MKHSPCVAGVVQDVVVSDASPPVSLRVLDCRETPATSLAEVSKNPYHSIAEVKQGAETRSGSDYAMISTKSGS